MIEIVVAAIGCFGVISAALLTSMRSFRKENREDHAFVVVSLNRIENKLDGHITDHTVGRV